MSKKLITLSGFGDFSEDPLRELDVREAAKRHGVEFYQTYYDHELKGTPEAIEAVTRDLWGMGRDEWADNALNESELATDGQTHSPECCGDHTSHTHIGCCSQGKS